uniref:Uncharacterized protein n=1 Tax=Naja naja TaxID=35670 RepID=A0A8C6V821_NAJNA
MLNILVNSFKTSLSPSVQDLPPKNQKQCHKQNGVCSFRCNYNLKEYGKCNKWRCCCIRWMIDR